MSAEIAPPLGTIADDLFAGAGGWDLAASALGIHARGVENMPQARATRDAAGLTTIHDDVWTYEPDGSASGLIASPPCQTFSAAGKGAGRAALEEIYRAIASGAYRSLTRLRGLGMYVGDERTSLVLTPLHFATIGGYEWLAWEQVPTVLPVWQACAAELSEKGWHTWTGLLHAEQYGVPQTRKRAFLLASRTGPVRPPEPTHSRFYNHDPMRVDLGVPRWLSMAEGLGWGLMQRPSYTVVGGSSHAASGIEWGSAAVRNTLLQAAQDGDAWREKGWGLTDRPSPTITGGGTATGGAEPIAKLARYTERDGWLPKRSHLAPSGSSSTVVDPRPVTEPAPTITGKGNAEWTDRDRRAAVGEMRDKEAIRLTPCEAGILQSFPADYPWQGNQGRRFLQAGNAVPPGLALHALLAVAEQQAEAVA